MSPGATQQLHIFPKGRKHVDAIIIRRSHTRSQRGESMWTPSSSDVRTHLPAHAHQGLKPERECHCTLQWRSSTLGVGQANFKLAFIFHLELCTRSSIPLCHYISFGCVKRTKVGRGQVLRKYGSGDCRTCRAVCYAYALSSL